MLKGTVAAAVIVAAFFVSPIASADYMQSTNFKVTSDVISVGGARATSTSYVVEDTLGEMATGEGLSSASFGGCSGFQCLGGMPTLTFSVGAGYTTPGVSGAVVALGNLSPAAVTTSDGSTVKSVFITASSPARGGTVIQVYGDSNAGLYSPSTTSTINVTNNQETLAAGTPGYGICVFSATNLTKGADYNGTCTKTTGHQVGKVLAGTANAKTILSASDYFEAGGSEILVKAAISSTVPGAADYTETLTFILTSTF